MKIQNILCLAILAVSCIAAASDNLLTNGSFEKKNEKGLPSGWNLPADGRIAPDAAEYLAAAGAARILPNDECDNRAGALAAEFLADPGKFIPSEPVFAALARPDASVRLLEAIASRLPE